MCSYRDEDLWGLWYGEMVLVLGLLLVPGAALGQSHITGRVVDAESGEPLPGANVFVDGQMIGTAADSRGRFRLANLSPGSYTVVASMVGYEPRKASVVLEQPSEGDGSAPSIRFALVPQPVELEGVTVEGSREEWLERLRRFRRAFFGIGVPYAGECAFANPEVLSFEESGASLIAHAKKPLRVHNEALGYEVTYHLSRYEVSPENRTRLGPLEFDTLEAQSPEQRQEWVEARRRTYMGSYYHFIDALQANSLGEEGFRVWPVHKMKLEVTRLADDLLGASDIFSPADTTGLGVLAIPRREQEHQFLEVRYLRKREHPRFTKRFRSRQPLNHQRSWIQFVGGNAALIDVETGDFQVRSGFATIIKHGYWGWYGTAATALPGTYRPSDEL